MTAARWAIVESAFHEAADLKPADRAEFLDRICAGDPELREQIELLLAADAREDNILEDAVARAADGLPVDEDEDGDELAGQKLGLYKVTGLIGKGGMGAVYSAVREDDFSMKVAVKLLKRGTDTDAALARFRFERQVLAWLQHPNIARLLDGGASPDGRPYFVMEYVEGQPITDYCEANKLGTRDRLVLFRTICSAVHYAHKNLVVHRDLKPGNILVTPDGTPKMLDFGIAKLLTDEPGAPAVTVQSLRVMTPEYSSPEQVRGEPVTTATDVYSLGVLLYELLTGRRPYNLSRRTPDEIASAICEQEPERPSVIRRESGSGHRIKGDLDNIVLMAMHKEPQRRYASVEQLSEDIGRYLAGQPVIAHRDTKLYRAGKFVRRHKVGVMATCAVALSLVAGAVVASWQAHIAAVERRKAEARFNDVRKLASSMLFELHDGIRVLPGSTPVRELLVKRALEYLDSLAREAEGDVSLQRELAAAYERVGAVQGAPGQPNLGNTQASRASYQKALAIREQIAASDPGSRSGRNEVARTYLELSSVLGLAGEDRQKMDLIRRALVIREELSRTDPGDRRARLEVANGLRLLATALAEAGDLTGSLEARHRVLHIYKEVAAAEPDNDAYRRNVALGYKYLGAMQAKLRQYADGLRSYQAALVIDEARMVANPTSTEARMDVSFDLSDIAFIHWQSKNLADALVWFHKSLVIREALAEEDPKDARVTYALANTFQRMALVSIEMDQATTGRRHFARAMVLRQKLAADDKGNVTNQLALAWGYKEQADAIRTAARKRKQMIPCGELRPLYRQALEIFEPLSARGSLQGESLAAPGHIREALADCDAALAPSASREKS
jgi:serine/threonine protein kinase/tetratricopeptide (TPR) repeat protein